MKYKMVCLGIAVILFASVVLGVSPDKVEKFEAWKFFAGRCSGCHGINGRGNPRVAIKLKALLADMDLQGEKARGKPDAELADVIMKGDGNMPAFRKALSGPQAGELVVFIRSMGPVSAGKTVSLDLDGAKIFTGRSCVNCHGKDGKGVARVAKMLKADLDAMDLTGKEAKSRSDSELEGIVFKGAEKGKMPAYGGKMTKEEIAAVVAYIRGLK